MITFTTNEKLWDTQSYYILSLSCIAFHQTYAPPLKTAHLGSIFGKHVLNLSDSGGDSNAGAEASISAGLGHSPHPRALSQGALASRPCGTPSPPNLQGGGLRPWEAQDPAPAQCKRPEELPQLQSQWRWFFLFWIRGCKPRLTEGAHKRGRWCQSLRLG